MNAGFYLAVASVLLLIFSKVLDLLLEKIDLHIFRQQLNNHPQLGLQKWFDGLREGGLGEARAKTVLKYALLAASARAAFLSLLVNVLALVVTWIILGSTNPEPSLLGARIMVAVLLLGAVAAALLTLCVQLIRADLLPNPVYPQGTDLKMRAAAYWRRFRSRRYLTVYNTAVIASAVLTGILSLGV